MKKKVGEVFRELEKPDYTLLPIDPFATAKERDVNLQKNYAMRVMYIHNECTKRFPEVADTLKKAFNVNTILNTWKQVLTLPEDRIYFEAAKTRAVSHEQRPPSFIELDLTDLDYLESKQSLQTLKDQNKLIESSVNSEEFKNQKPSDKRKALKNLFKTRDESLHPIVFCLTLNVDDLPNSEYRKLNALHALGQHDEAKKIARQLVSDLRRKAIAEYRNQKKNNMEFSITAYRSFS